MTREHPRGGRAMVLAAAAVALVGAVLAGAVLTSPRSAAGSTDSAGSAGTAGSGASSDAPSGPSGGASGGAAPAPDEDSVAVGFSRDMAVHHQQAVEMSFRVLRNGTDQRVRTLAYDIANTQATQRGMLLGWLSLWGRSPTSSRPAMAWMNMPPPSAEQRRQGILMPGMAARSDMDSLDRARGREADLLFLRLMTRHHRGGVHMAEGVRAGTAPEPVVRLARGMVEGQQSEIALMKSLAGKLR